LLLTLSGAFHVAPFSNFPEFPEHRSITFSDGRNARVAGFSVGVLAEFSKVAAILSLNFTSILSTLLRALLIVASSAAWSRIADRSNHYGFVAPVSCG